MNNSLNPLRSSTQPILKCVVKHIIKMEISINISLPQIEGMVLKNATVNLKKGVVVAKYGEEEYLIEAKKGDFLTLKTDPSKVVIFDSMAGMLGGVAVFIIIYDLPTYINGVPASTPKGVKMPVSRFRHSTEREKQFMIKEMAKWGKRYNPKTYRVEDIEKEERNEQLPCLHLWKSRFNEKRGSYVICSKCSEER